MKSILLIALLTIYRTSAGDVLEYTDSNFNDRITEHDLALVEFYAPWCGHCKKLAPEYESAATTLVEDNIALIKVDCTAETTVCGKYGVSGYPTLKIFKNGEFSSDYEGERSAQGIIKTMRSKAGPSSREIADLEGMFKFLRSSEHSIVGFFSSTDTEKAKLFKKLADSLSDDFRFAHTYNADVLESYKKTSDIVIFVPQRLHNKFEANDFLYGGADNLADMKSWVQKSLHGLCGHRTVGTAGQFPSDLCVAYFEVDYIKNPKGTNYWRNRILKVVKKLREASLDKLNFALSKRGEFSHELSEYGLSETSDKPVVGCRYGGQKYVMTDEFSMDNLETFAKDIHEEKLKPHLKSEPVPDANDEPVKVVVANNFDTIVNDPDKDVLIEFYAPWCGHCKSLAPKYDELASKMSQETSITIAKMDATANDVPPQYNVRGFPTLYFVPAGDKKSPVSYDGGREVSDFIKYLAKESTQPLKGWSRSGKKQKVEL